MTEALSGANQAVHTALCRHEIGSFLDAARGDEPVLVACTQEEEFFTAAAAQAQPAAWAPLKFVNIRETAGWSSEGGQAWPKIQALVAAAKLSDPPPTTAVEYQSNGKLAIIGPSGRAVAVASAAQRRHPDLQVTVLMTDADTSWPKSTSHAWQSGSDMVVNGHLGAFTVSWKQSNPIDLALCTQCGACIKACPTQSIGENLQVNLDSCDRSGQCEKACEAIGAIRFDGIGERREASFDLVLDLSDTPTISQFDLPPGYEHCNNVAQGLEQLALLSQWVGRFEKPKYFNYQASICAHGRNQKVGCNRCVEICSTHAIHSVWSNGKGQVSVNPKLCLGCGACSTVCPTGAIRYAYPTTDHLSRIARTMVQTVAASTDQVPDILLHSADTERGGASLLLALGRRASMGLGNGLPARMLPLAVHHIASVGAEFWLALLCYGVGRVVVMPSGEEAPAYRETLETQVTWAQAVLKVLGYNENRIELVSADGPRSLDAALAAMATLPAAVGKPATFAVTQDKRQTLEAAIEHLLSEGRPDARVTQLPAPLPDGGPFGAISVDPQRCTLCMACVGSCPGSALKDGGDQPILSFIERDCVQCGICADTCPEKAITLTPRLLEPAKRRLEATLCQTKPFHCVRCHKPFATEAMMKTMLERIGSHTAFGGDQITRLSMCSDCRVIDMMEKGA